MMLYRTLKNISYTGWNNILALLHFWSYQTKDFFFYLNGNHEVSRPVVAGQNNKTKRCSMKVLKNPSSACIFMFPIIFLSFRYLYIWYGSLLLFSYFLQSKLHRPRSWSIEYCSLASWLIQAKCHTCDQFSSFLFGLWVPRCWCFIDRNYSCYWDRICYMWSTDTC